MYGWNGTVLVIDLSKESVEKERLDPELARRFLGGRGLNGIRLFKEVKAGADPLGPGNVLLFGVGPCNGTLSLGSGRYNVTAKSPLTGGFGDANSGGYWGAELKLAGYDQIVVRGKAKKPVYIFIDDDEVEIRDASHIWGKDTFETDRIVKEEIGDSRIHINYIGQAGENQVRFANVMTDLYRAAGRTGMGAVMGSKNLKAIAVRGTKGVRVKDPEGLKAAALEAYEILYDDWFARLFSEQGSACLVEKYNTVLGALTRRNNQETFTEDISKLDGEYFEAKYKIKAKGCYSCPLHCGSFYLIKEGPHAGERWGKTEFATISNFTTRLGIDNMEVGLMVGKISDKYGIDIISLGGVLGFAMECYEHGLITQKDAGLDLSWGNEEAVYELTRKIVFKEGIGATLAEGVRRAAEVIGGNADDYALHTKGMEHLEVDPRALQGWGLAFAVSSRGADHLRALPALEYTMTPQKGKELFGTEEAADRFATGGKGRMVKWFEELRAFADSMEICKYITRTGLLMPEPLVKLLNAVTGEGYEPSEAFEIGERIVNVEKAFNVREGLGRKDDTLPKRFLTEPIPTGPAKGQVSRLEEMLDQYYEARGWDIETGLPKKAKLEELCLDDVADELQKMSLLR
ncbi:MAG: aldehyde ferredoxin oxidoreductase family protein [Bacillota bacterium]